MDKDLRDKNEDIENQLYVQAEIKGIINKENIQAEDKNTIDTANSQNKSKDIINAQNLKSKNEDSTNRQYVQIKIKDIIEEQNPQDKDTLDAQELQDENIIEAILFTMGNSVELRQLALAIDADEKRAKEAVERLKKRYEEEDRAMQIIELESSYQMCTKAKYYESLIRVAKTPKKQILTEAVLETLSIIAYRQPVTKAQIDRIRGVSSDYAVNKLLEYGLVYEAARLDAPGRPVLFATTEEFLRRFGVVSVSELPNLNPDEEAKILKEVEKELSYTDSGKEDDKDGDDLVEFGAV